MHKTHWLTLVALLLFTAGATVLSSDPKASIEEVTILKAQVKLLEERLKQTEAEKAILQERVKNLEEICRRAGIAIPGTEKMASPGTTSRASNTYASGKPQRADDIRLIRVMTLDAFLIKYSNFVSEYRTADTTTRRDEVVAKVMATIKADMENVVLTVSGEVGDVQAVRDGGVMLSITKVDEVQRLKGKPVSTNSLFSCLYLSMTKDQAAKINKGDKFIFRGRPRNQSETGGWSASGLRVSVVMMVPVTDRQGRHVSQESVSVGDLVFAEYSCTIGGGTYESWDAE